MKRKEPAARSYPHKALKIKGIRFSIRDLPTIDELNKLEKNISQKTSKAINEILYAVKKEHGINIDKEEFFKHVLMVSTLNELREITHEKIIRLVNGYVQRRLTQIKGVDKTKTDQQILREYHYEEGEMTSERIQELAKLHGKSSGSWVRKYRNDPNWCKTFNDELKEKQRR